MYLNTIKRNLLLAFFLLFTTQLMSCGGGGGGSSEASGVTRDTAIRILHGAIDISPLAIQSGVDQIVSSRFLGETSLSRIESGPIALTVSRRGRPAEVFQALNFTAENNTEYSVFAFGAARDDNFSITLLTEPVERPQEGMSRVRFLNGVSDLGSISCVLQGQASQTVSRGGASEFFEIPSGTYNFVASSGGRTLESRSIVFGDREEVTILTAGKSEFDYVSVGVYRDLD